MFGAVIATVPRFHSWRYGGRAAIRQLIKQDPATYLRIMINVVGKLHTPSD